VTLNKVIAGALYTVHLRLILTNMLSAVAHSTMETVRIFSGAVFFWSSLVRYVNVCSRPLMLLRYYGHRFGIIAETMLLFEPPKLKHFWGPRLTLLRKGTPCQAPLLSRRVSVK